jgi:hypothetical protein
MDKDFLAIFDLASPYLNTRENDAHTRIAYQFAIRLLNEEAGDPQVVFPALILHDVGWKSIPEELQLSAFGPGEKDWGLNRIHEVEGARIAGEILEKVNYPPHLREEITEIILGHDSRKEAISLNDAIVKDSDKLWRYSAHGVSINFKRFPLTLSEHLARLRRELDGWFLTRTGKRIAREELRLHEECTGFSGENKKQ